MRFLTQLPEEKLDRIKSIILPFSSGDLSDRKACGKMGGACVYEGLQGPSTIPYQELTLQRPSVALLQTCTQVHHEAVPMYLSLNRFIIQNGDLFDSMRFTTSLPDNKLRHIKSLVPKFSPGDLSARNWQSAKDDAFTYIKDSGGLASFTREQRQDNIHRQLQFFLLSMKGKSTRPP